MVRTGDIVIVGPVKGQESWFQRGIQLMGSTSTHNELIYVDEDGVAFCGCAHTPFYELVPWGVRVADWRAGKTELMVCRWHEWPIDDNVDNAEYRAWRGRVAAQMLNNAELRLPYDKRAIRSIARNWLRSRIGLVGKLVKHTEHAVFCTESCEIISRIAGRFLFGSVPEQAFYAPVHVERIFRQGQLNLIADFGMNRRIAAGKG